MLQLFRIDLLPAKSIRTGTKEQNSAKRKKEHALLCGRCGAIITNREEAVSVNDHHEHAFFNPAGIAFEIRCFGKARGCEVEGSPTGEFSWFSGYSWQYAICASCLSHLGWFFTADGKTGASFFGLRASLLRDVEF